MVKCNYFDKLEKLSLLSESAVLIACSEGMRGDMTEIRLSCDRLVCETEDALFSDFIPPMERDNIAAAAHTLSRVVDKAYELISDGAGNSPAMNKNEEAKICIKLSEELSSHISLLKKIRKPGELPDLQGFRRLLCDGRSAHKRMVCRLRSGALPRSYAETVILTGRLRSELSLAFDEIVEIMLNNI